MAQERKSHRVGRGGIQIKTVRRPVAAEHGDASGSGSASRAGGNDTAPRRSRMKKPSVRYREKAMGAAKPGENFFPDAKMAEEFERRVLDIYAPTPDLNESVRELPLRLQAQRDGKDFKLPGLGQMCLEIISNNFASRVLPYLQRDEQLNRSSTASYTQPSSRKKRKVGIFGLPLDDEDDDEDFVPDAADVPPIHPKASKRSRGPMLSRNDKETLEDVHESNSYILSILPIAAKERLQSMLEIKSPQHLSCYVLGKYFLNKNSVHASRSFKALSTVGGLGDRGIASLLRSLCLHSGGKDKSGHAAANLEKLHLQAFTRLTTQQVLPLFDLTVNLQEICLRGCISIDAEAMKRLVKSSGRTLRRVNLNWTGVKAEGVEEIIRGCPNLEVLKIAHVQNLNDATVTAMMDRVTRATIDEGVIPLNKLKKLKINGTQIGIVGLGSLLKHCGSRLESLDIGYTRVGGEGSLQILFLLLGMTPLTKSDPKEYSDNTVLRKLNMSGLSIPAEDLASTWLYSLKSLRILDFREMRTHPQGSGSHDLVSGISNCLLTILMISLNHLADTRTEERLDHLNGSSYYLFERVSISNKVSFTHDPGINSAIKPLNASSIRHLDYSGVDFVRVDFTSPRLEGRNIVDGFESMDLSGCALPDRPCWELIGAAGRLQRINLSGTKVTEEDVDRLLKENPFITHINLTGCRGIPVTRRRRYFETMQ